MEWRPKRWALMPEFRGSSQFRTLGRSACFAFACLDRTFLGWAPLSSSQGPPETNDVHGPARSDGSTP